MEKKTYTAAAAVKDADQGLVMAEFATLDVVDLDGDVTVAGAFGKQAVKLAAWGHDWGSLPVGKGDISEEAQKAVFDGQFFLDTVSGNEHFKTVRNLGDLQEWSYGFNVKEAIRKGSPGFEERLEAGGLTAERNIWRFLVKLDVFEVSPVMRGAGIGTRTTDMKEKGQLSDHAEYIIEEAQAFVQRCQSVAGDLEQEGRLLSGAKRERLFRLVDLMQSVRDETAELLKRTEPPAPERVLELQKQFERIEAVIASGGKTK